MRKFNLEGFLEFIVFLGFATFLCYLLYTGKIYNFISPRMKGYMIFSFVFFTILALYKGNNIFVPQKNKFTGRSYIILIITLVIGFIAAKDGLDISIAENKGLNLSTYSDNDKFKEPNKNEKYSSSIEDNESKTIIINEKNFYNSINEIGLNVEKYAGKKVKISGFVFLKEDYKKGEFVVARMLMACCAADAQVVGLMSKIDTEELLEKESWIEVEGVIEVLEDMKSSTNSSIKIPVIKVERLTKIKKPENIYVYP